MALAEKRVRFRGMLAPAESSVSAVCQPDVRQHTGNASTHKDTEKKDLAHMRTRLFMTPNRTVAASEPSALALSSSHTLTPREGVTSV